MPQIPIPNFHNARLSLVQSFIREVIGKKLTNTRGSGLFADHPMMRAAGATLVRMEQGLLRDAGAALGFYDAELAARRLETGAPGFPAQDCLDLLVKYAIAWALNDTAWMEQIKSEFTDSPCDPGWLVAAITWLEYYWDGKLPDYAPPTGEQPQPIPLPPPAAVDQPLRVGILGDWGTGEEEARAVLDQLMQQTPDVIIHVGDIYYSGTHDECVSNFLDLINHARAKYRRLIPVYTLPGNHDYYSGGLGFYTMLAQLNLGAGHAQIQQNSFFCLQNDSWQLEGMDTGYNDHDLLKVADDITKLRSDEAAWHAEQLAAAGTRKVILLSHHQLFSAFATIGAVGSSGPGYQNPYLLQNLATWRATGNPNIVAWLWGHEHLLEVYAVPGTQSSDLAVLGRCVGHSAFPVFNNQGEYTPITNDIPLESAPKPKFPNGYVQTGREDEIYAHGYVLLTLGAESGTANYYQVNDPGSVSGASSQLLWSEPIPAPPQ
jgi:Calcineurin-like phosphoesterase